MSLHKVHLSRLEKGVTFIEVTLVVALIGVIAAMVTPVSLRFYTTQQRTTVRDVILEVTRNAQLQTLYVSNTQPVGVKLLSNTVVLFEGNTYADRDETKDVSVALDTEVQIIGTDEVVFTPKSGEPATETELSFVYEDTEHSVIVHASGLIE